MGFWTVKLQLCRKAHRSQGSQKNELCEMANAELVQPAGLIDSEDGLKVCGNAARTAEANLSSKMNHMDKRVGDWYQRA